jgi:tetratricopeptide (TPR) repeat protein
MRFHKTLTIFMLVMALIFALSAWAQQEPLDQVQVFALLAGGVQSHRVTMLVQKRGIDFEPTDDYFQEVRLAGGEDELISALKGANMTKPVTVDPAAATRQAEVRQHAAHGGECFQKGQYTAAAAEYRAAIRLDLENSDLHVALSRALIRKRTVDEALAEAREAIRLSPNNDMAHYSLGYALGKKGDPDGAIAEYRETLRLNPMEKQAHYDLGRALEYEGDRQGALEEFREAYILDPKNALYKENYERLLQRVKQ